MGALHTEFSVSSDFDQLNCLDGDFELGEDPKYLTIKISDGKEDKEASIDLSKTDAIMLKQWLEATIIVMEE